MRIFAGLAVFVCATSAGAAGRIVFVRHGEKPDAGLGQLDCRGLNRALALPAFLARAFGRPDAIFAPNPAVAKKDSGVSYDYVRPLATIEPTAISLGLPVNAGIGFDDVKGLQKALEATRGLAFVAWEHKIIVEVARGLLQAHGGDPAIVPEWEGKDFDGVYVVTIPASGPARFERMTEGLDGRAEACPR